MKRLAAFILTTAALVIAPASTAEARPSVDRDCIVAAIEARDMRAAVACFDGGTGASAQRIDWD